MDKWDLRFLDLAKHISNWSRDPSTKVGAVITENKRLVSVGFNGFPQHIDDMTQRYTNRDFKIKMVVHAELNAILFSSKDLSGMTIYTYPMAPCSQCAGAIIQKNIKRVIAPINDNPRWKESIEIARLMFEEAGVKLDLYDYPIS